jgi:steroid delta-isomerase-like uncharacterized protein
MESHEGTPAAGDREMRPSFQPPNVATPADVAGASSSPSNVQELAFERSQREENEHLMRRSVDHWNRREMDAWEATLAPDVKLVVVAEGKELEGPRAARDYVAGWALAFPDAALEVTNVIASSAGVAFEYVFRGTHTGPLTTPAGVIDPTGRSIETRACWISEIDGGKVRRACSYYDAATIMRGLGLVT